MANDKLATDKPDAWSDDGGPHGASEVRSTLSSPSPDLRTLTLPVSLQSSSATDTSRSHCLKGHRRQISQPVSLEQQQPHKSTLSWAVSREPMGSRDKKVTISENVDAHPVQRMNSSTNLPNVLTVSRRCGHKRSASHGPPNVKLFSVHNQAMNLTDEADHHAESHFRVNWLNNSGPASSFQPCRQHQHRRTGSNVIDAIHHLLASSSSGPPDSAYSPSTNLSNHSSAGQGDQNHMSWLLTSVFGRHSVCEVCEQAKRRQEADRRLAEMFGHLRKIHRERVEKQELHEMQQQLDDLRDCGCTGFRPKAIQHLANIKLFVFLLSVLVTVQQALSSGYLNSVITTIEKRYEIPSSVTGFIASMYEVGNLMAVLFVSYFGSRRNIPSWIGMGAVLMSIGSLIFALPHFLSGPYWVNQSTNMTANLCHATHRSLSTTASVAGLPTPIGSPSRLINNASSSVAVKLASRSRFQSTPSVTSSQTSADELLNQLPGLETIKTLAEGLGSPHLGPQGNDFRRESNCIEEANESSAMPIFIFMVAQLLLGVGGSPLFTLGTTYIDNHVKRDDSSVYISSMYAMCAFGPVCGFLLGAYLLSHYVETFSVDIHRLNVDSAHSQWIGMWWGGFLICGLTLMLVAIPFFLFPKQLKRDRIRRYIDEKYHHASYPSIRPLNRATSEPPAADATCNESVDGSSSIMSTVRDCPTRRRSTVAKKSDSLPPGISSSSLTASSASEQDCRDSQLGSVSEKSPLHRKETPLPPALDAESNEYGKDFKDIPRSVWNLMTNSIYLVTCMGACTELSIVSGFIIFLPKYLETQFNLSKSTASIFTGGVAIPGACIGIFLSGYLLKRLQLRPRGAVLLVLVANIFCLGLNSLFFLFGCDNIQFVGATVPHFSPTNNSTMYGLEWSCNSDCSCDVSELDPVCGSDGLTYVSPCHAGCASVANVRTLKTQPGRVVIDNYTDCACVLDSESAASGDARSGPCYPSDCQMILPFLLVLFLTTLVVALTQMPLLMVVLRAVDEAEKAFALGIQFVLFRLFGHIPSPIFFGAVIDSTCLVWRQTCDAQSGGRCLLYDIELFRFRYVAACCGLKLLSLAIFTFDWYLIRRRETADKAKAGGLLTRHATLGSNNALALAGSGADEADLHKLLQRASVGDLMAVDQMFNSIVSISGLFDANDTRTASNSDHWPRSDNEEPIHEANDH